MCRRYTTYEAKAKFSEILRKVCAGQHVIISYRGEAVAVVRPPYGAQKAEATLREMEEQGSLSRPSAPAGALEPLARRPSALKRFLESRS